MNRLFKLLLVFALTTISYGAFAQHPVTQNSIHMYKMGDNIVTNKYLWRVQKDDGTGTMIEAIEGTDYEFVTSYTVFTVRNDIALATTDAEIIDHTNAEDAQNVVFVKWLETGTYDVTARVFDNRTFCSDDKYNVFTFEDVIVGANNVLAHINWNVRTGDESNVEDCAIQDVDGKSTMLYTVTIEGHRAPTNLVDPTQAEKDVCDWRYKYEYYVGTSSTEPGDYSSGIAHYISGDFKNVSFDLDEYNANGKKNKDLITIKEIIPAGDAKYYVWVRIIEMYDGYATAPNNTGSVKFTNAVINQLPLHQTITQD